MPHVATQIVVLAVVLGHLVPAAAVSGSIVTSLRAYPTSRNTTRVAANCRSAR